jgi:cysteine desulfurase
MGWEHYFDHAATTPLDPRALEEMRPFLEDAFGNAHSLHSRGTQAMAAVDRARERVAALVGADDPSQIFFTSGATEANNWVLRQQIRIAVSPFEHSAVLEPARRFGASLLPHDGWRVLPPEDPVDLVSLMSVNNEVGTVWEPSDLAGPGHSVHSDLTQSLGKIPIRLDGVDYASMSAHKLYGPKGVGALFARTLDLEPLLFGGEQEHGMRGGTLNVPGIVGFGAAAAIAADESEGLLHHVEILRASVLEALRTVTDHRVNGGDRVSPFILSVSFMGIEAHPALVELDRMGFSVGSGAACSSRKTEPSHVLTAHSDDPAWMRGTLRISFGRFNTEAAAAALGARICTVIDDLRRLGNRNLGLSS